MHTHTHNPVGWELKDHTYLCSSIQMMTPWQVINNTGFVRNRAGVTEQLEASAGVILNFFHAQLKVRRQESSTIRISILKK